MGAPILCAELLYLSVGIAAPNLNVPCETWKLLLQEFEWGAPLRLRSMNM